ncbi:M15 family metallopeptidase [Brevundimonas goettingensis]|uniref:D-alanyl-D-alanine carboxypeptidase family protein n=1 Tax=Brevundimonas goettingensis TaxID=2774190 RepID=A0A975GWE0_9CAUL|nr:M15 family metallopeptidase [Brevundimonas goettingensis]QTC92546.1 D-alanyl-D-alanine carboxypeptidase family protein [Brevundimonas goettingensis]
MGMRAFLSALGALSLMAVAGAANAQSCDRSGAPWSGPAFSNAVSVYTLEWSPFGKPEMGWETYLPLLQRELRTDCAPGTPDFAAALAAFQGRYALTPTGVFDQETFAVLKGVLQERRPFVMARTRDECPEPPPLNQLGYLSPEEEHADRLTRLLRRDTLEAYRAMAAAARREVPAIAADPELLQIFSGFRDPEADAARCAAEANCDGVRRAACSPHRTGAAVDLYVGHMEGMGVDSTDPASRLYMTRGPTYRWLVANAARFGFVPYLYEPWHWEFVGTSAARYAAGS